MARFQQREFVDETVMLDGNSYENCSFTRCRFVYAGGALPTITAPSMRDCEWELTETAGRVLILLRGLVTMGRFGPATKAIEFIQGGSPHQGLRVTN
jgi:hypothetical protein